LSVRLPPDPTSKTVRLQIFLGTAARMYRQTITRRINGVPPR